MKGEQAGAAVIGGQEYWRRVEVARRLGVSVRTVERRAQRGDGPPFTMLGRIPIYPAKALDEWIHLRLVNSTRAAPDNEDEATKGEVSS